MSDDIFKCGIHDFSTNDIKKWDEHCLELEHEYDLHMECGCGEKIHIKPKQTLSIQSRRIPRGYLCVSCREKVKTVPEIMEGQ